MTATDFDKALGLWLQQIRVVNGWTRRFVIRRMDNAITTQALANYERGRRPCPVSMLVEICRALDVSAGAILGMVEAEQIAASSAAERGNPQSG